MDIDAVEAKKRCIIVETGEPCARLADLDVYAQDGAQVDRARLGLPARACLLCALPAVECMRAKRHDQNEVIAKAHALLVRFRP